MAGFRIATASSIHEIDPAAWNHLSYPHPFQSYRWYIFGERVMADYSPTYLLVYDEGNLIARASFWLIHDEPLPEMPSPLRALVMSHIKRWPLFICRSPLSNTTGIVMSETLNRNSILSKLTDAAFEEASRRRASLVVFDYLDAAETHGWPSNLSVQEVTDPGTKMDSHWANLDEYFSDRKNCKNRRHYKRTLRETEQQGIQIYRHNQVPDVETALALISNMDKRHNNAPVPWMRNLLENIEFIDGIWLDARIGKRMVGGMLILEDNSAQITLALGLADDVPYTYFLLLYASLGIAFERKVQCLLYGSGAYETKRRLGFKIERNNHAAILSTNHFVNRIIHGLVPRRI
jgi:predicted N-acyltransferase